VFQITRRRFALKCRLPRCGTSDAIGHGTEIAPLPGMHVRKQRSDAASALPIPESPTECQREGLVAWLDAGLRRGENGRLAQEYPLSMLESRRHRCVFDAAGAPVSHAMWHPTEIVSRGRSLHVGMIGNVYSEPRVRGRGLASACVIACAHDARKYGAGLALLWSDARDFYRPLGFHPVGRETIVTLDAAVLARTRPFIPTPICVGPAFPDEWPRLEALYERKPQRVQRRAGDLARLAAAPETTLRVARFGGRVVGYAVAGRGDDFRDVVHEWAGDEGGVLACLGDLFELGVAVAVLSGPEEEAPIRRLRAAGAAHQVGCFALGSLLDADLVWRAIAPGEDDVRFEQAEDVVSVYWAGGRHELSMTESLDLMFGAGVAGCEAAGLPAELLQRLAPRLPHPLYVWGFDSI
jgi:GNAT superfamily N-acetyltransferase